MREMILSRISNDQVDRLVMYVVVLIILAFGLGVVVGKAYAIVVGAV